MEILMIGNSYTFYHKLPVLLEKVILENGREARVDSVTVGGRKLYENLNPDDPKHQALCKLLSQHNYDVLFLQEQSYFALIDPAKFEEGVARLTDMVAAKRTILYATWGRKSGCPMLEEYGWTSETMSQLLAAAYHKAAQRYGAEVSDVGRCFARISERYPKIELYESDLSHPSYLGSCATALSHYKKIFGELPKKTTSLEIDDVSMETIRSVVNELD